MGGGLNSLKPQKLAFTLAEVLITLAIIGIVAALTIPTLVSKNEKKQLYTQFMKSYNTISNALNMAIAQHGDPSAWTHDANDISGAVNKYLLPYFKVAKTCNSSKYFDCMSKNGYSTLNGAKFLTPENFSESELPSDIIVLADGTSFVPSVNIDGHYTIAIYFNIDINGPKGPNVLGRDFFPLEFRQKVDKNYKSLGYVLEPIISWDSSSTSSCDPLSDSNEMNGVGCASRLLQEGGMNY